MGRQPASVDRFGYTVKLADLPLLPEVVEAGESIILRWTAFAGMNHWLDWMVTIERSSAEVRSVFFEFLRQHLLDDFEVLDESVTAIH